MDRRPSRWATKTASSRPPNGTLPRALAGSVVVHVVLACLFFSGRAPRPVPPAQLSSPAQLAIEVDLAGDALPNSIGERFSGPADAPEPAARPILTRREAKGTGAAAGEAGPRTANQTPGSPTNDHGTMASPDSAAAASTDAAATVVADRFATFRPAHPDLNPALGLRAPEPAPRDLLAAPTLAKRLAGAEPGKARTITGPGDVTASVAEDGTIGFDTPSAIRPKRLPLYSFRDGEDDGGALPGDPQSITERRSPYSAAGEGVRVGVSGRLDVTDLVMKMAGQDAHASTKRALAEETRDERQCMAIRARGERMKEALSTLAAEVRQLATRRDLPAAKRRQLVFEIWDECSDEPDAADHAAMARATVLAIVREAFPAGTDQAYRPAELLAFNDRRTSRQRFSPYDAHPIAHPARQPDGGLPQ